MDDRNASNTQKGKRKLSPEYNLEVLFPELSMEWDYNKNGSRTPRNTHPYSNARVHWRCLFDPGHSWVDRVGNRTILYRGCPLCAKKNHSSYFARALLFYLRQAHINCDWEKQVGRYAIDIALFPEKGAPIALELDGYYVHKGDKTQRRDREKDAYLREKGYRVIRVRERGDREGEITFQDDVISYPLDERHYHLDALIQLIMDALFGISVSPDHRRDHWKIQRMSYHDRRIRSIAVQHPGLSKQWSKKNVDTPDVTLPGSGKKRWWKCPKCGREYQAIVQNRVRKDCACPYCANQRVTQENCLAAVRPDLAEQWHPQKNKPLTPYQVVPGTDQRVWWLCPEGHEWCTPVSYRTVPKGTGCPVCGHRKVIPETSLAAKNPALAAFWHPEKNTVTPWESAPQSNIVRWWRCPLGHEWQMMPNRLTKFSPDRICPYCDGRRK